jgi:hypothetical protein
MFTHTLNLSFSSKFERATEENFTQRENDKKVESDCSRKSRKRKEKGNKIHLIQIRELDYGLIEESMFLLNVILTFL